MGESVRPLVLQPFFVATSVCGLKNFGGALLHVGRIRGQLQRDTEGTVLQHICTLSVQYGEEALIFSPVDL